MRRVRIAALRRRLSAHLRAVEHGAEIEVTDRDRPIVRIIPAREPGAELAVMPATRPFAALRRRRHPPARWPVGSTVLLREERGGR